MHAWAPRGAGEVVLCMRRLDGSTADIDLSCLSADETARAQRFHFERDRGRFIAARAWLRHVLAAVQDVRPRAIVFTYGAHGKPALAGASTELQFNLSHAADLALLALRRGVGTIGADVEAVRPMTDVAAIARANFAPAEFVRWQALPVSAQQAAFFACWTRKEAYVKAHGAGLSVPLDSFEVSFTADAPPALLSIGGSTAAARTWSMWCPPLAQGFAVAVVAAGQGLSLRVADSAV